MKKYIFSIILGLSLIFSTSVFADNFNVHYSVSVYEGWNLLHGFGAFKLIPNFITGGDISSADISAIFVYLPSQNKYARVYPNPEIKIDDEEILNSAFWVYLKKSGKIAYDVEEEWAFANNRKMVSGWNFIGTTPDILGKNMGSIRGDCDIKKVFAYVGGNWRNWFDKIGEKNNLDIMFIPSENAGIGFIMKVSSDCTLGSSSSNVNPPIIPN